MLDWIDSEMCMCSYMHVQRIKIIRCMWKLLKVRLCTLLTEAIFLLLSQVAKGVREANAYVYHLVILYAYKLAKLKVCI